MKYFILCIILIFSLNNLSGQNDLGQTKRYIISKNELCRIIMNDSALIIFECGELDKFISFYGFDSKTSLCNFIGYEIPKTYLDEFKKLILDRGYSFYENIDSYPIIISLKGGNKNNTSPASIYETDGYTIVLLKYDLYGDDSTSKFGVYAKYKKEKIIEK